MNRREFIRRGGYLAGAFACLPSGVVLAEEADDVLTVADIMRLREMLDEQAIPGPHYVWHITNAGTDYYEMELVT